MFRIYRYKEGGTVLSDKKIKVKVSNPENAKNSDVAKAIVKSNKKHAKMLKMLAE